MKKIQTVERQGNYIRFQITVDRKNLWFLTHAALHVEEIGAIALLELYGTKEFLAKYCPHGIIHVGALGGEFDEHPVRATKKEEEYVATLATQALGVGVRKNAQLKELLQYVLVNDLNPNDPPKMLAACVNMLLRIFPKQTAEIFNHLASNSAKNKEEYAATLVAQALKVGVRENAQLKELLQYVLANDLNPNDPPERLAACVNMLLRIFPMQTAEIFNHLASNSAKKEGECAATLVARALGVRENEELKGLLQYVLDNDLRANDQPDGLATYVNMMHRCFPMQTGKIINWALVAIRAKIKTEKRTKEFNKDYFEKLLTEQNPKNPEVATDWLAFAADAKKAQDEAFKAALVEIKEKGQISKIKGPNERTLVLLVVESNNNEIGRSGRFKDGANADIVVQKRPSGHVTIHSARRANLKFFTLARILRYEEQKIRGKITVTNWRELSDEGICPSGVWYFHHQGQFLLNGSITAPATPPTFQTLERICELIQIAVHPETFEPARAALCKMGKCASKPDNACPWYAWGIPWCQTIRAKEKK